MAKQISNKKGFKVSKLSKVEVLDMWGKYGGVGICERCNEIPAEGGYYVAVLNQYLCTKCYKDWIKDAKVYEEDKYFENINFTEVQKKLQRLGYWEQENDKSRTNL